MLMALAEGTLRPVGRGGHLRDHPRSVRRTLRPDQHRISETGDPLAGMGTH